MSDPKWFIPDSSSASTALPPSAPAPSAPAAPAPATAAPKPTAAPTKDDRVRAAEDAIPGAFGSVVRGMRGVSDVSKAAADAVLPVPTTVPEAAFTVGSMLAGPARLLPIVSKLPLPLMRVILGATAEGGAEAATGGSFSGGATKGVVAGTVGEALGGVVRGGAKVVSKLKDKMMPASGGEGAAKAIGTFAGEKSPPLAGATNTEQLAQTALGRETKPKLGQYFENRLSEAETLLGAGATINVPALAPKTIMTQYGPMPAAKLQGGTRMTLREASEQLAELRLAAYGGAKNDPTNRSITGAEARKTYGEALKQIDTELRSFNPEAAAAWNDGRHAYAVGSALISVLQKAGIGKTGEPLDLSKLREVVSRQRGSLQERMGRDDFKALVDLVFHGGPTQTARPRFGVALPERVDYPVDLPQIMINATVNRLVSGSAAK